MGVSGRMQQDPHALRGLHQTLLLSVGAVGANAPITGQDPVASRAAGLPPLSAAPATTGTPSSTEATAHSGLTNSHPNPIPSSACQPVGVASVCGGQSAAPHSNPAPPCNFARDSGLTRETTAGSRPTPTTLSGRQSPTVTETQVCGFLRIPLCAFHCCGAFF